jgi:hypothetical protein
MGFPSAALATSILSFTVADWDDFLSFLSALSG